MPSHNDWIRLCNIEYHRDTFMSIPPIESAWASGELRAAWERQEELEKALRRLSEVAIDLVPSPHADSETAHEFELAMQQAEQALGGEEKPMKKQLPRYSGPNRSGVCRCGCSWEKRENAMKFYLLKCGVSKIKAQLAGTRELLRQALPILRGRHSTLTYAPKELVEMIEAQLEEK